MLLKNVKIGITCLLPAANLNDSAEVDHQDSKYRLCKHGGEYRRGAYTLSFSQIGLDSH